MAALADAPPVEYLRVEWERINPLAREGWRLVPMPPQRVVNREMFVLERPLPGACHADHLMED